MKQTMKRGFSFVLALCMVLSLIVMPKAIVAHAEGVADILSEHVYYHNMNEKLTNGAPVNWSRSKSSQNANGSAIVESSGRTYLQLKRDGTEGKQSSYFHYQDATNFDTSCVLRYDLMVDNRDSTEAAWTVYIPALSHAIKTQTQQMTIKKLEGDDKYYLYFSSTEVCEWTPGEWYTVEQVFNGNTIQFYLNGNLIKEAEHEKTALGYIVMGIHCSSSETEANVGMNLDELYVYDYVAGTGFAAGASSYQVDVDGTVATGWTKSSADAYLPSVEFSSSNEEIATVDGNGVVTGVSEGQVTITATPAASSGLPAASVNVSVGAASAPEIPGNLGALLASNSMDVSGTNALYPLNWTRTGQQSNGSSFITDSGRTYYQMKRNGTEGNAVSWLYTTVDSDYESVVLKYDVMIDNGSLTDWSVSLPAFTDNNKERPIAITVKENALQGTDFTLEAGRWYTVELILVDTAWSLYVDGAKVSEGTIAEDKTIAYINMGISNTGGNPAEGQSAGANVAMNIDNFTVYEYIPETDVEQNVATVGGQGYASVQDAVNYAVENGGTVVLQSSTDETITVAADKELFIDFNGNTVGEITVNGTLYGIDATTKDYTAEPLKVKVSGDGTVAPVYKVDDGSKAHAYAGYAAKVDEDGYATFNYFELKISSVTLRPGDAGIGYKLDLAGNANVKAMLDAQDAFGVRVYRADNAEGGKKASAGADSFDAGTQTKMVMIKNILSDAAEAVGQNATNLDVKLCVEAYMNIGGETVAVSFAKGTNLREVLVAVDATVDKLDEDYQKPALATMYEEYDLGNEAYGLVIPNIAGLASSKEG